MGAKIGPVLCVGVSGYDVAFGLRGLSGNAYCLGVRGGVQILLVSQTLRVD